MSQERDCNQIIGQLTAIYRAVLHAEDDTNDAWCEGLTWDADHMEWGMAAEKRLAEIKIAIQELIRRGNEMGKP